MKATETKSTHSQQHGAADKSSASQEQEHAFFSESTSERSPFFNPTAGVGVQAKLAGNSAPFFQPARVSAIQMKCTACEAEEREQAEGSNAEALTVQRMPAFESDEADVQRQPISVGAPQVIQQMPAFESDEADVQRQPISGGALQSIQRMSAFESDEESTDRSEDRIQRKAISGVDTVAPQASTPQPASETQELEEQEQEEASAETPQIQMLPAFSSADNSEESSALPPTLQPLAQEPLVTDSGEEPLAAKTLLANNLSGNVTSLPLSSPKEEAAGSDRALPPTVRARMETAFHHDFGHVRIHTGEGAAKAAADQHAHAFTSGRDISFGANEFAPYTTSGDRLLAHELTHVVQHDEGRMPSRGVLSPNHELEREAYTAESRITSTLPSIDEQLDTQGELSAGSSRYGGEPTLVRPIDNQVTGDAKHQGPNTTEAALMGPLPSAAEARAEAAPPQPLPETPEATPATAHELMRGPETPETVPATLPRAAPELMREAHGAPAVGEAMARPETPRSGNRVLPPLPASAAGNQASPPALVLQPAPALHDPMAWEERLASEGAQRIEAVQVSAATSIARIRAQAENAIHNASSAFAAARTRFEATAQTAFGQIEAFRADATQCISTEVATQATELDTHFAVSAENARGSTDEARTHITQTTEREANRSISESAARAARARGLAQKGGTAGEAPLADGQREIASRVSDEVAQQCLLTGQDAAAEVRKAGASRLTGVDVFLNQVLQTLERARNAAHGKLAQSEAEAMASVAEQAAQTTEEIEARRAEGLSGLDQQETSFTSWIQEQAEQECAQISARAEEGVANLSANLESITGSFNEVTEEVGPIFAATSPEESGIGGAQVAFNDEMARIWTEHVAPQLAEGDRLATSFDEHAGGVEQGLMRVCADALSTLEQTVSSTIEGLATLAERFGNFVETAVERVLSAVRDGIAGACAEADRAVAEHTTAVTNEAIQAEQAIQSAVEEQLAWEDQQIDRASEEILVGQSLAAQQYRSLEAQARARDEGGASAAIARGWLGDLWDWFSDLAEGTLEWFQEKLGEVWGNIIGQILRAIIYVVGVIVCEVAWVGAQVINLVWGFIWGETAIPGYGGGLFNFIGDIVAGIIFYGDIRDIFKYFIYRIFINEEGPLWLNIVLGILSVVFLIPIFGDIGKIIVKAIKGGGKSAFKVLAKLLGEELAERIMRKLGIELAEEFAERLAREVGKELAERMIRELGTEGAEELLERLGNEAIQRLGREISPTLMRDLANELGERTLKRLAKSLGGNVIRNLSTDLGREAIEKLLRTVGPEVVEELHRRLGKDVLLKLLDGLRGVTIKEYLDALGETALRNLGRDLNGYAVKDLFDDLGADLLRRLATDLGGETVQQLANELGERLLRELTEEFGARGVKELVDEIGVRGLKELVDEFGVRGLKELVDEIGARGLKELVNEFGVRGLKELVDEIGARGLKELVDEFGVRGLKELVDEIGVRGLKELVDEFGVRGLKELVDEIGVRGLKELVDEFGVRGLKELVDEIGVRGIREVGVDALIRIGSHLTPSQIADFIREVGSFLTKKLAKRYGGRAMAHYGVNFFKAWKGVTNHTIHHLVIGHGIKKKAINGCHDLTRFVTQYVGSTATIEEVFIRGNRRVGRYVEYTYSTFRADGSGLPRAKEHVKTVIDGLEASLPTWKKTIVDNLDDMIRNLTFPQNPGRFLTKIDRKDWVGWFRNGRIDSIYPVNP
jgi:hypothetical protein